MKSLDYFTQFLAKTKAVVLTTLFFLSSFFLNLNASESKTETLFEDSPELQSFLVDCEEEFSPRHCKRGLDFAYQTKLAFSKMQDVLKKSQNKKDSLTLPELSTYSLKPDLIDFRAFRSFDGKYTNEKCQSDFNLFFSENDQSILTPEEVLQLCSLLDPGYLENLSDRVHPYFKMASSPLNSYLNTDAGRNFLQNVVPLFAIHTFLPSIAKIFIKILEFSRVKDILVADNLKSAFDSKSIRDVHKKFFGHLFVLVPAFFAQNFKLYLVSHNFSYEWAQKFTFISLAFFYIHFTSHYVQHSNSIISSLNLVRLKELSKSALALEHISDAIKETLKDYDLTRIKALGSGMQILQEISVSPNQILSSMNRFSMGFFSLLSPVIAFGYDAYDWFLADYLKITGFGIESWFSHFFAVCSASFLLHYTMSKYHKRIQEIKDEREKERDAQRKKKADKRREEKSDSAHDKILPPSFFTDVGSTGEALIMRPMGHPDSVLDRLAREHMESSGERLSPQEMHGLSEALNLKAKDPKDEETSPSIGTHREGLKKEGTSEAGPSGRKDQGRERKKTQERPMNHDLGYEDLGYGRYDDYDSGDELLDELSNFCAHSSKYCQDDTKKNK